MIQSCRFLANPTCDGPSVEARRGLDVDSKSQRRTMQSPLPEWPHQQTPKNESDSFEVLPQQHPSLLRYLRSGFWTRRTLYRGLVLCAPTRRCDENKVQRTAKGLVVLADLYRTVSATELPRKDSPYTPVMDLWHKVQFWNVPWAQCHSGPSRT
jgi:hypothetical protein